MTSISPPQTSPLYTPRAKNLALLLLAMTQFVVVIDASIVNVALPSIGSALHFSRTDLSWVVNAYALTFGGFLLLGGRGEPRRGGLAERATVGLGQIVDDVSERRARNVRGEVIV